MICHNTQEQLRHRFNPEGSDIRLLQNRLLEILQFIDSVCKENGIKYWLSSGTCLGAVRHGGFIPWDDDADIEMHIKESKRLKEAIIKKNDPRFKILDHSFDHEYTNQFFKVIDLKPFKTLTPHETIYTRHLKFKGPFVDVFAITPSNSLLLSRFASKVNSFLLFRLNYIENVTIRKRLKHCMYLCLSKFVFPIFRTIAKVHSGNTLRHVPGVEYLAKRNRTDFEEIQYFKFENTELPIPKNFDRYLKSMYGDYMCLPDLSRIETHIVSLKQPLQSD